MRPSFEQAFAQFFRAVRQIVLGKAQEKGYSKGADGDGRELLDFIKSQFGDHPEGEIVYKLIRWRSKKNPEDLLKAAAWIFLIYDQHHRMLATGKESGLGFYEVADTVAEAVDMATAPLREAAAQYDPTPNDIQIANIMTEIAAEAMRAEKVHKPMMNQTQLRRLKVLRHEVEEVQDEVFNLHGLQNRPDSRESVRRKLRAELIQVAAVCTNWIKNIHVR